MYTYKRDIDGLLICIVRDSDGASIPDSGTSPLRVEFDEWVAGGGIMAIEPINIDLLRANAVAKLRQELDAFAESRYDSNTRSRMTTYIASNATSADPTIQSKVALCESVVAWVDSLFVYYYTIKATIMASDNPESVTWSTDSFDATNPNVTLPMILQ